MRPLCAEFGTKQHHEDCGGEFDVSALEVPCAKSEVISFINLSWRVLLAFLLLSIMSQITHLIFLLG